MKKALLILLFLCPILTLCTTPVTEQPTPTPDPQTLVAQVGTAMEEAKTLHFVLEQNGPAAFIDADGNLVFRRAEGDFASPDQMQATVKVLAGGFVAEVGLITLGNKQWMTNVLSGEWEKLPAGWGFQATSFFDSASGLPYIIRHELNDLSVSGPEKLDDLPDPLWHLTAKANGEQMKVMSGGMISSGQVEFEAWFSPTTFLLHRVKLILSDSVSDEPDEWLMLFNDYDAPVSIQPPK